MRRLEVFIAVIVLTGCADSGASVDDATPSPATTLPSMSDVAATNLPAATSSTAPSTTPPAHPATTTTSTSTTSTTIAPGVVEACRSLNEDPLLEARRRTWSEAFDQAAIERVCPEAASLLRDALVIVERQQAFGDARDTLSAKIDCQDHLGRVSFLVEHPYDFGVGTVFLPTVTFIDASGTTIERSSLTPAVGLDMQSGQERRTTAIVPAADQFESCGFTAPVFLAEDPDLIGDGARPIDRNLDHQELDDADVWLIDLFVAERSYRADGAPYETFADLLGIGGKYPPPVTPAALGELADDEEAKVTVCDATMVQGSDRHAVITFEFEGRVVDDETGVESQEHATFVGLLRRGSDGRWRWLAAVDRLDSSMMSCEAWRAAGSQAP